MVIEPSVLLERMAATLRRDIGPAVADEFARTQAFMASVILTKLAAGLASAGSDAQADATEHGAVAAEVRAVVAEPPPPLAEALDALAADGSTARWSGLVEALYAARERLGPAAFDGALAVVRATLRSRLDRALAAAR
jgi:hypothetical protein